jgi:putative MATE family efflux protein
MIFKNLFDDKIFYKNLILIAVPIMVQNLINAFVNMLDTVMIGQLGTVEIAAVGLGNQVFFLYNMILFGISSGGAVFTAQYWGKGDIRGIRRATGFCLTLGLSVALLFTLLTVLAPEAVIGFYSADGAVIKAGAAYIRTLAPSFIPFSISFVFTLMMRSTERVRLPIVTTLVALTINLVLNYLLIFGKGPFPALGVVGAAIATVIARFVEMGILVAYSYEKKYPLAGSIRELFDFSIPFILNFLRIALPVMVNELLWSLGITMQNVIFARTGTDAIAAFNITNTVSQLTWVFFMGIGNGAGVLIGKKIGAGEEQTARDYARRITIFGPLTAVGASLILIPLSWTLPFLFRVNDSVFSIISGMFIILSLVYPFRAFNMSMIIGVCRAGGDTVFSVIYDILFMWAVTLPLAAAASFIFNAPVWFIYLCIAMEDPLKMIFGLARLRSGKWLRNVTVSR